MGIILPNVFHICILHLFELQRDGTEHKNVSLVISSLNSLMTDQAYKLETSEIEAVTNKNNLALDILAQLITACFRVISCSPEVITGQECHRTD